MRLAGRTPVHIGLVIIALVWLVPTIGLLVTSFRPRGDIQSSGWWTIFAGNLDLTIDNYTTVLGADLASQSMFEAFLNTLYITVPATILPLILASLAAYAFAWVKFPFRDTLFLAIIALLLVPLQMTLIPLEPPVPGPGADRDVLAHLDHSHHLRAAVRDLPASELLHHAAEGPDRGRPHRRRLERSGSSARSSSHSRCRRWRATRSSSSSGSGTTCSWRSSSRRARLACR